MPIPEKPRRINISITLPLEIIESDKARELIGERKFSEHIADLLYNDFSIKDNRKIQEDYIKEWTKQVLKDNPELLK